MADSPTVGADGPVGVIIKVDGTQIPDSMSVLSVNTRKEIGRIPEATVKIETGSIADQQFNDVDGSTFALGAEVELAAYYGSQTEVTLFKGLIFTKRLRIAAGSSPQMHLVIRDKAQVMTVTRKDAQYLALKDSDIISAILSGAGLTADVEETTPDARDQIRHNCTDWDFLRALADRNGQVVHVSDGAVTTAKPDPSTSPVLTLTLGLDVYFFDAAAHTGHLIDSALGTAWDDGTQDTATGESVAPQTTRWGNQTAADLTTPAGDAALAFATPANVPSDILQAAADARVARGMLSAMRGRVSFPGSGRVNTGDTLELGGFGEVFSGDAYVSGVEHRIEAGEWTTETTLGLPDDWRADSLSLAGAPAGALTPPMTGLQIGKVTEIIEDPGSRLRIQVVLPVHGPDDALVWARYATPYASTDAGVFFMPEINDEVVVGFLGGDPDNAIVLGSMHNAVTAQPYEPDEPNTYKAIVTKNALKIEFEDVKKILTISTPGGHSIVLDDDATEVTVTDSTGNELKMSASGIDMQSPGDINISADGNISIVATGDAAVEGMNVDVTAQTQLTASGSAGAEVSSSGQTVVKGSIVMIN